MSVNRARKAAAKRISQPLATARPAPYRRRMIRIAISQAAFDAIASTLPLGSVGYEAEVCANGERLIWLAPDMVNRLRALRGPGEFLQRRHIAAGWGGAGALVQT